MLYPLRCKPCFNNAAGAKLNRRKLTYMKLHESCLPAAIAIRVWWTRVRRNDQRMHMSKHCMRYSIRYNLSKDVLRQLGTRDIYLGLGLRLNPACWTQLSLVCNKAHCNPSVWEPGFCGWSRSCQKILITWIDLDLKTSGTWGNGGIFQKITI